MSVHVALLRAINVGGTGKLAMSELCRLCEQAGFKNPKTYIQSGNVVFASPLAEARVKAKLERALAAHFGKPFGVLIRSAAELEAALTHHPFVAAPPNRVLVVFLDQAPARELLRSVVAPDGEELHAHAREVFVHYPNGMGQSKLRLPFGKLGTGRNLNTVAKLAAMARDHE